MSTKVIKVRVELIRRRLDEIEKLTADDLVYSDNCRRLFGQLDRVTDLTQTIRGFVLDRVIDGVEAGEQSIEIGELQA